MHLVVRPRQLAASLLSLALLALVACAPAPARPTAVADTPTTLRVGIIPNQAPDRQRAQYEPFRQYLERTLGQPVETFVATDYTGVVEAMASEKLDLAYFGGLTFAQAERRVPLTPIVTEIDRETGTEQYYSAIIVSADSPVGSVAELKGKRFAFGDINSTSGSLYPRLMLDRAGISDFSDPQRFIYTGGHDATTLAVANRTVDAGGVEKRIMERLFDAGTVKRAQIRILQQTPVQGYPWAVRAKLDAGLVDRLTRAFLDLRDSDLLRLMRAERYTRVQSSDYDEVRREAVRLGLIR